MRWKTWSNCNVLTEMTIKRTGTSRKKVVVTDLKTYHWNKRQRRKARWMFRTTICFQDILSFSCGGLLSISQINLAYSGEVDNHLLYTLVSDRKWYSNIKCCYHKKWRTKRYCAELGKDTKIWWGWWNISRELQIQCKKEESLLISRSTYRHFGIDEEVMMIYEWI